MTSTNCPAVASLTMCCTNCRLSSAGFLTRAAAFFAACGIDRIDRIERVITDNAWTYRKSAAFRQAIADLGAEQRFIRPHCPWTNGKVERFNRTPQTEWAYHQVFTSNTERAHALAPWLTFYNTRRRHTGLAGQPPISRPVTKVMTKYT